jgi:hypothetical protein
MPSPVNTRRWMRHPVELPVRISPRGGDSRFAIPGRGIEISEGGMTLYAGLPLNPGDYMDVEFETAGGARIAAVVRNRTGFCFGLEFLTPLSVDPKPTTPSKRMSVTPKPGAPAADVRSVLRSKELEMERLRREIATLRSYSKDPS